MAARNPTSFTNWIDETLIESGKSILAATPDSVLNDQVYVLDAPRLIVSWAGLAISSSDAAYTLKHTIYVRNKEMCDVDTVSNDEISCIPYAFVSVSAGTTTAGDVQLVSTTGTGDSTSVMNVPSGTTTSGIWVQGDAIDIKTNDTEDTIQINMRRTSGAANVQLLALGIIASET